MKDLTVANNTNIHSAFLEDDVVRRLDVKLDEGTGVEVILTYKDKSNKKLGAFTDETYVKNNHIRYPFNIEEVAKNININVDEIDHLIAAVDINCDGSISKGEELKLNIVQPLHILVLVAGTTDPVNKDDVGSRAHSYDSEYMYWDTDFTKEIKAFAAEYVDLKIFPFHGWTGDNSIKNREIAGAYLVNRLCGAEGQKAFYEESYQKRTIHFHLLGHSHGGNVMNEMTKQMDKLGTKWPEKWKVKSLTYLSTPFFNNIHQVKVTDKTFHKEAEVFNAYNKYDLTQTMLADFSLEPLAGAIEQLDTTVLKTSIDNFIASSKKVPFNYLDVSWSSIKDMNHTNGLELYSKTIDMLEKFNSVFVQILELIKSLNKEYAFAIDSNIKDATGNTLSHNRQMISDGVMEQFKQLFDQLIADVNAVNRRLNRIVLDNHGDDFSKLTYVTTLFEATTFALHLNDFIDIKSNTLSPVSNPSLWGLLAQVLHENIDNYDNTYADPTVQFDGTPLSGKITQLEVTHRDIYNGSKGSQNYEQFIKSVERIEKNYENAPTQQNLLDLLFILLAQENKVYDSVMEFTSWKTWLDYAEYIATGEVDTMIKRFRNTLENLDTVFNARSFKTVKSTRRGVNTHYRGLIDERDTMMQRGSLMYLLQESHSTSRRKLHPELKTFLEKVGAKR